MLGVLHSTLKRGSCSRQMKMKRALVKSNPVDSHMNANLQSPNPDDKRIRLERRWRRREVMVDSLKNSRVASATKTALKICGSTDVLVDKNDHTIDDETDEEWKTFLATYTSDNDDEMDEDYSSFLATYTSDTDDEMDEDYRSFLATYNSDIETDCASDHSGGYNINCDETDAEYISFLATYDPDVENDSPGNQSGGSNVDVNFGNNNVNEELKEGDRVDVDEDDRLLRKSFSVGQKSLVSDQDFDTPKVRCVVDEDYERFLNSGWVVDGDFVYDCDKNTKNTSNVEDESNSSDSDLIVLESYPNCENTPFVSSKAYDSSCFVDEMHPKDNMQMTFYHSQFRKRLMEYLDRPYDYEEYKSLLAKANERRQKERHLETRQGVIKSYHSVGVSKSYLDLYPDFAKAIATESKENRILFLLRGFFFWLQNAEGKFQPWLDESCLETMRRM